jgi:hypothetical protein
MLRAAAASPVGELQQTDLELTRGIPLYRLEPVAGVQAELAAARLQAWRYLVLERREGRAVLVAEVEDQTSGDDEDGRSAAIVGSGDAAIQLVERLSAAEALPSDGDYELRIIEIPKADVEALWLHGAGDRFLDLIRPDRPEPESAEQFLRRIQTVVELRNRPENLNAHEMTGDAR